MAFQGIEIAARGVPPYDSNMPAALSVKQAHLPYCMQLATQRLPFVVLNLTRHAHWCHGALPMKTSFRSILLAASIALIVWAAVMALAMVNQLAQAAELLHTGAGTPVFLGLLLLLAATVLLPTVWLLHLPPALRWPDEGDLAAVARYQQRLRSHLARNPHLEGLALHSEDDVQHALAQLRSAAESETQRTAAAVLTSTALLQNGRLDALVVLVSQVQLVWRIARIYGLRPSWQQMAYLYGNVGACVLVASSIEEVDFAELTAPLVQSATPAALASVPGLGGMGQLLTNSLASGAANAFLTLRVGLVADAYCAPQHAPARSAIRQGATHRAAQLLGGLVKDSAAHITQAVYGRIKHGIVSTAQAAADSVKQAGRSVSDATQSAYNATAQSVQHAAAQVRQSTTNSTQRFKQSILPKDKR